MRVFLNQDQEVQHSVVKALDYEPTVHGEHIGVRVGDGVVTLGGRVASYSEKYHAIQAARRVKGVRAVVDELEVAIPTLSERSDTELAQAVIRAFEWHTLVPLDKIKVTVQNGWVALEGQVEWHYQREAAAQAVRHLVGVKGIINEITLRPRVTPGDVKERIEAALARSAQLEAEHVRVRVDGGKIVLNGQVRTWLARAEAERAAWAVSGVDRVDNQLHVVLAG